MKLNKIAYNKLVLQAQEAKELGLTELADAVLNSVGATPREEDAPHTYSSEELNQDIHRQLWKIAMYLGEYHDLFSLDIQRIDEVIKWATENLRKDLENSMGVTNVIGPLEPKLPGESK